MVLPPLWPSINALLNATSAILLLSGYVAIRKRIIPVHRACMASAFGTSTIFLISYVAYHFHGGMTRYTGQGLWRWTYFSILLTHTILAVVIVPLILRTLYLALHHRWDSHRALARWTFPLWLYVSVTGVVIYAMLY